MTAQAQVLSPDVAIDLNDLHAAINRGLQSNDRKSLSQIWDTVVVTLKEILADFLGFIKKYAKEAWEQGFQIFVTAFTESYKERLKKQLGLLGEAAILAICLGLHYIGVREVNLLA